MVIRRALDSDKAKVLEFCKNTFEWGDYIETVWDDWKNDLSGILLVKEYKESAESESIPIGIAHLGFCINNVMWIEGIRVQKNFRNQGIASSLLQHMINHGLSKGYREANALVAKSNITSQKLLEKHNFVKLFMCNYYNIELEKLQPQHKDHQSKLSLKDATTDDVSSILNYLHNHPTVSSYTKNRFFNSWKFYKFEINFQYFLFLLEKGKKIVLIRNDKENVIGMVIINITTITDYEGDDDNHHNRPIIQICYLDCIDNRTYSQVVDLLIKRYSDYNRITNLEIFLPDIINLTDYFKGISLKYFEQFYIFNKKL